ncbi:MAG: hypothetical protein WCC32_16365 [Terriglobales bacterium]
MSRVLSFFKEPNRVFQRAKSRFKERIALGAWFALFLWLGFMVGLFGRLSQGLLRGENEFDWRAAAIGNVEQ